MKRGVLYFKWWILHRYPFMTSFLFWLGTHEFRLKWPLFSAVFYWKSGHFNRNYRHHFSMENSSSSNRFGEDHHPRHNVISRLIFLRRFFFCFWFTGESSHGGGVFRGAGQCWLRWVYNSTLKMTDLALKMTDFALRMMGFALKMMDIALKIVNFGRPHPKGKNIRSVLHGRILISYWRILISYWNMLILW